MPRFLSIWFPYLKTDWCARRWPGFKGCCLVLAAPDHSRMMITAANKSAHANGIKKGMALADARVLMPSLQVMEDPPGLSERLLKGLAQWCIRYSPIVNMDTDGLLLDVTGCAHLWNGEETYLKKITTALEKIGYSVRACIADTIGAAWALARCGKIHIVPPGEQLNALLPMPSIALRIEAGIAEQLHKLGLTTIAHFINIPRNSLRRRFGEELLLRLDQALGKEEEQVIPLLPPVAWQERLPCLEPVLTLSGIEMALLQLLEKLCSRLQKENKGLRKAVFICHRADHRIEKIETGTHRPSNNIDHLFKLFELRLGNIEPAMGIELFILEAPLVEDRMPQQEKLWASPRGLDNKGLPELLDRISNKFGSAPIQRFLPGEHHWPERSYSTAALDEKIQSPWHTGRPRPLQLLPYPEPIEVTAPIPDYPPMLFRYKKKLHTITKADGPERIEQEWWIQQGQHRDYYYVEDEEGCRFWLFRLGHYHDESYQWYLHGFFA